MPTYQYQCTACGEGLEVVQKFTDDALTTCPNCQGTLRKVFSAVGIVFKGSGFYRTDSRTSSAPAKASTSGESSSNSSSESSSTSGSATPAAGSGATTKSTSSTGGSNSPAAA